MLKSPVLWLAALWVAVMLHVDWHLGRAGHDHRSFELPYHWLVAVPTFVPVAWLILRKWPAAATSVGLKVFALGVVIGQGLEPLGEMILFNAEPFTNRERWRVFAEFSGACLITLFVYLVVARWYHARPLRSEQPGSVK